MIHADIHKRNILVGAIKKLAVINKSEDTLGEIPINVIQERRNLIRFLVDEETITLEDPPENGKFYFNDSESQEIYVNMYNL